MKMTRRRRDASVGSKMVMMSVLCGLMFCMQMGHVIARPLVRHIRSASEFDKVLQKHATETGLPVIADFYSDGCGPCRMIAPVFRSLAQKKQDKAVFVKVDTNQLYELSGRYGVRSLPTFLFFVNGKKVNEFSGASEQQLVHFTDGAIDKAERENVLLTQEAVLEFYHKVAGDTSKTEADVSALLAKCADMVRGSDGRCIGAPASQLARKLKQKYGQAPKLDKRFNPEDAASSSSQENTSQTTNKSNTAKPASGPNLHLATKEQLMEELEKRLEAEMEEALEKEVDDDAEFQHGWAPSDFPERVTIIGGGPAGMAAAIYASRAGLEPVVVAPPMGGQLQGKGVDVENYPGLRNVTGPAVVSAMRDQAVAFGAKFETDLVTKVDTSIRPFKVYTNESEISTHAIIVATGAESRWLGVPGEYDLRGAGVSSCATCDGAAFYGRDVIVVGGGDTAMEEALVLARTSSSVTIVHRRDTFRASTILAKRAMEHPKISVMWNSTVEKIRGEAFLTEEERDEEDELEEMDLDDKGQEKPTRMEVVAAVLKDVQTGELTEVACTAVFVAIGHIPATEFLDGIVQFYDDRPGYIRTFNGTTKTSVEGIFAAGDVADSVYRQAVTSAGSGAAAALDAERWLSEEGLGNEAAEFEAELMAELMAEDNRSGEEMADNYYNVYEDAGGRVKGVKENVAAASASATEL